jgi:hypothetical protein
VESADYLGKAGGAWGAGSAGTGRTTKKKLPGSSPGSFLFNR